MPKVFRTYQEKTGPDGKRVRVLDAHGQPVPHPKWRAVLTLWTGKRKTVTLHKSRVESQRQADALQGEQDAIRSGRIEPPNPVKRAATRLYAEVAAEYQAWGEMQGGRGGRPWSKSNAHKRRYYTAWWGEALGAKVLGDLENALPQAEKALRDLGAKGRGGKTLTAYREGLFAFCHWCKKRRYLRENPFEFMGQFDSTPKRFRRAMTPAEIRMLLSSCPLDRSLLYETNFASGFRASELRSLDVSSLDRERGGLRLAAEVDKGRKERLQPLPTDLVERLATYAETGAASDAYRRWYAKAGKPMPLDIPATPLLYVPTHPARVIQDDLTAAGIPVKTAEGVLDFHACRTAYINLVISTGADIKTAQSLARHSSAHLTLNVYGRAQDDRLSATAEAVGRLIRVKENRTATEPEKTPTSNKIATPEYIEGCDNITLVPAGGIEPPTYGL